MTLLETIRTLNEKYNVIHLDNIVINDNYNILNNSYNRYLFNYQDDYQQLVEQIIINEYINKILKPYKLEKIMRGYLTFITKINNKLSFINYLNHKNYINTIGSTLLLNIIREKLYQTIITKIISMEDDELILYTYQIIRHNKTDIIEFKKILFNEIEKKSIDFYSNYFVFIKYLIDKFKYLITDDNFDKKIINVINYKTLLHLINTGEFDKFKLNKNYKNFLNNNELIELHSKFNNYLENKLNNLIFDKNILSSIYEIWEKYKFKPISDITMCNLKKFISINISKIINYIFIENVEDNLIKISLFELELDIENIIILKYEKYLLQNLSQLGSNYLEKKFNDMKFSNKDNFKKYLIDIKNNKQEDINIITLTRDSWKTIENKDLNEYIPEILQPLIKEYTSIYEKNNPNKIINYHPHNSTIIFKYNNHHITCTFYQANLLLSLDKIDNKDSLKSVEKVIYKVNGSYKLKNIQEDIDLTIYEFKEKVQEVINFDKKETLKAICSKLIKEQKITTNSYLLTKTKLRIDELNDILNTLERLEIIQIKDNMIIYKN